STTGLVIFGGTAATGVAAGVGDEAFACCEPGETLSCFLHIERFRARNKERIANRIIIKEVNALSAAAQNTSAFCGCGQYTVPHSITLYHSILTRRIFGRRRIFCYKIKMLRQVTPLVTIAFF